MPSKKITIIIVIAVLLIAAGAAAYFLLADSGANNSYSGTYTPRVPQDETTFSYIINADIQKEPDDMYGDVYITLSGTESELILESSQTTSIGSSTEQVSEVYESVEISPNQRFAAIQGQQFGSPYVFVYQAFTGTAQEKVDGTFTGWTTDGRMQINQCTEADAECLERISKNSKDPWILTPIVIEDDSILGNATLSPEVDFISNIQRVGNLSVLSNLIRQGGRFIDGAGPFTIFAPTNAAFSAMDQTVLSNLSKPENRAELQRFLRNHIIVPQYTVLELSEQTNLVNAENAPLAVEATTPANINGDIAIEIPDIITSNGIIHIVDMVFLLESEPEPTELVE